MIYTSAEQYRQRRLAEFSQYADKLISEGFTGRLYGERYSFGRFSDHSQCKSFCSEQYSLLCSFLYKRGRKNSPLRRFCNTFTVAFSFIGFFPEEFYRRRGAVGGNGNAHICRNNSDNKPYLLQKMSQRRRIHRKKR